MQKARIFLVISLCLGFVLSAGNVEAKRKLLTIAVFDFDLPGNSVSTQLNIEGPEGKSAKAEIKNMVRTNLLTDKIVTEIVKSKRLSVVERSRLDAAMKELDFSASEMTSPKNSIRVGRMLGAKLLLFGVLNNMEGRVESEKIPYTSRYRRTGKVSLGASIRIVNAETGKILAADQLQYQKCFGNIETRRLEGMHIQRALNGFTHKLVYMILNEIFPVKVALAKNGQYYLNRGSSGGITRGDTFKVIRKGETIIDEDTGVMLGSSQTDLGTIEVVSVESKMSIAKLIRPVEGLSIAKGDICKPASPPRVVRTTREPDTSVDDVFK